jgi:hypothetical protein
MTEHLNLASVQFFPFLLWAHQRLLAGGGRRYVVLTALFFAANATVSWHYGLFGVLALGLMTGIRALSTRSRAGVAETFWSLALGSLLVAPFALPLAEAIASGREYVKFAHERGSLRIVTTSSIRDGSVGVRPPRGDGRYGTARRSK